MTEHKTEPGTLEAPKGSQTILAGIGAYDVAFQDENGDYHVAEAFDLDGYEINEAGYDWPHEMEREVLDTDEFRKQFNVPQGFRLFVVGCNDQREGGYAVYTSGKWINVGKDLGFETEGQMGERYLAWDGPVQNPESALKPWLDTVHIDQ